MKLTLRVERRDGATLATWNGKPIAVDAIARELAGQPDGATVEAECRYESSGIVATRVLGAVRRAYDVPGFEAAAEARKHYEAGRPDEACRVLEAAPELPLDGIQLHASLNRSPAIAERLLVAVMRAPAAGDHDVAEVASAAVRARVDRGRLSEILGEKLGTPTFSEVAHLMFDDMPLSDAPRFWVQAELERFRTSPLLLRRVYRGIEWERIDDARKRERVTRVAETLAAAARAHGLTADLRELEATAHAQLAVAEQEEHEHQRKTAERAQRALARLEERAGRALPDDLREAWLKGAGGVRREPQFSFVSLARYFADGSYGAWSRLESLDLTDPRWLVFGAEDGTDEMPPYFALDVRSPDLAVYQLDPEQGIEDRIAKALRAWDGWKLA